jgi:hypothetical protein
VFSEYNLIESGYLFQTNLSKQWMENIRTTKSHFQLLMEESKMKLQNAHNTISILSTASTTNTIRQSLPSLTSPSLDLPVLKLDDTSENIRRSSKVESDVFKIVEQTRRNSRSDRKNFGRYFTADGTSTHGTDSASIKPISSAAIIKRMSWNNEQAVEKNDSSLITNSFRSVHSSSGVSSTGSFLFSTDEDSSMTTTTSSSIPSIVPSTKNEEFDGKSSSSTVVGTDDQILLQQDKNCTSVVTSDVLINSSFENTGDQQLSSSSSNTLISNNQTINGMIIITNKFL